MRARLPKDIIRQDAIINWIVALLVNEGSWLLGFLINCADSGPNLINNHYTRRLKMRYSDETWWPLMVIGLPSTH